MPPVAIVTGRTNGDTGGGDTAGTPAPADTGIPASAGAAGARPGRCPNPAGSGSPSP